MARRPRSTCSSWGAMLPGPPAPPASWKVWPRRCLAASSRWPTASWRCCSGCTAEPPVAGVVGRLWAAPPSPRWTSSTEAGVPGGQPAGSCPAGGVCSAAAMPAAASSRAAPGAGVGGSGLAARMSDAGVQGGAEGCSGVRGKGLRAERGVPAGRPSSAAAAAAAGVPTTEAGVHGGAEGSSGVPAAAGCLTAVRGVPAGRPSSAGEAAAGWAACGGVQGGAPSSAGVQGGAASWGDARRKALMTDRGEPAGSAPNAALQGVASSGSSAAASLPAAAAPKLKLATLARLLLSPPGVAMKRSSDLQAAETSPAVGIELVAAEAAGAAGSSARQAAAASLADGYTLAAAADAGVAAAACPGAAGGVAPAAASAAAGVAAAPARLLKYQGLSAGEGETPKLGGWMPSRAAEAGPWPGLSALPRLLAVSSLDSGVLPKLLKGVAKSPSEETQLWKADAGAGLAKACGGSGARGAQEARECGAEMVGGGARRGGDARRASASTACRRRT